MTVAVPVDLIDEAVLALLRSQGLPVLDGVVSPGTPFPYTIFYAIPGSPGRGPYDDPDVMTTLGYQLTSVGQTRGQARNRAARSALLLTARGVTGSLLNPLAMPSGWVEADRTRPDGPGGADMTGDSTNRIFSVVDRYLVVVTPE